MFSLVKIENWESTIVTSQNVKRKDGVTCSVKIKGAWYSATLILESDKKENLLKYKNEESYSTSLGSSSPMQQKPEEQKLNINDCLNSKQNKQNISTQRANRRNYKTNVSPLRTLSLIQSHPSNGKQKCKTCFSSSNTTLLSTTSVSDQKHKDDISCISSSSSITSPNNSALKIYTAEKTSNVPPPKSFSLANNISSSSNTAESSVPPAKTQCLEPASVGSSNSILSSIAIPEEYSPELFSPAMRMCLQRNFKPESISYSTCNFSPSKILSPKPASSSSSQTSYSATTHNNSKLHTAEKTSNVVVPKSFSLANNISSSSNTAEYSVPPAKTPCLEPASVGSSNSILSSIAIPEEYSPELLSPAMRMCLQRNFKPESISYTTCNFSPSKILSPKPASSSSSQTSYSATTHNNSKLHTAEKTSNVVVPKSFSLANNISSSSNTAESSVPPAKTPILEPASVGSSNSILSSIAIPEEYSPELFSPAMRMCLQRNFKPESISYTTCNFSPSKILSPKPASSSHSQTSYSATTHNNSKLHTAEKTSNVVVPKSFSLANNISSSSNTAEYSVPPAKTPCLEPASVGSSNSILSSIAIPEEYSPELLSPAMRMCLQRNFKPESIYYTTRNFSPSKIQSPKPASSSSSQTSYSATTHNNSKLITAEKTSNVVPPKSFSLANNISSSSNTAESSVPPAKIPCLEPASVGSSNSILSSIAIPEEYSPELFSPAMRMCLQRNFKPESISYTTRNFSPSKILSPKPASSSPSQTSNSATTQQQCHKPGNSFVVASNASSSNSKNSSSNSSLISTPDVCSFVSSKGKIQNSETISASINNSGRQTEKHLNSSISIFNSTLASKSNDTFSEYFPNSTISTTGENVDSTKNSLEEQNKSVEIIERPLKLTEVEVPHRSRISKKHFCLFCKTLQTKLARHFYLKHNSENEIREIQNLPKRSKERIKILEELRKKGDFLHNTTKDHNSGILIVCRQQQVKGKNKADDYVCCKNCKAFYSKNTLRIHLRKCGNPKINARDNLISGRKLTQYIHKDANFTIRTKIFPVLRNDDVTKAIRYDELIIRYGNKLAEKYAFTHQHDMIRSHMRLLGRFLLEIKKINVNISQLKNIYNPKLFKTCVKALRTVANWDDELMWFRTPAVAQSLTSLIKKCGLEQELEFIQTGDEVLMKDLAYFLKLWERQIPHLINKKAFDDQCNQKRTKKVILPSKQDIKKLYMFLKNKMIKEIEVLGRKFDENSWNELVKTTLIFIQIFNRRRAGEIERLTINNFINKEIITENIEGEIMEKMSEESIALAKQFVRLTLRGKLGRTVSVLLDPLCTRAIDLILKYRTNAGITKNNEYIFSKKNSSKFAKPYYRACPLLRQYSLECGAERPESLRGTSLRKHIATYTSLLNLEEASVDQLANFMGHHKDIHKNVYRVPIPVAEITCVSKLLMSAIGDDNEVDEEDDENEEIDLSDQEDTDSEVNQNRSSSNKKKRRNLSDLEDTDSEVNQNRSSSSNKKKRSNLSDLEDTDSEVNQNRSSSSNKKKRSTSPFGKTKRIRWSEEERDAIYSSFGDIKLLEKLPSAIECLNVIKKHKVLKRRTPLQVKTWIDNQRRYK